MKPQQNKTEITPLGQAVTTYEALSNGWYIVKRDSINRVWWSCGPYRTQKQARKADAESIGH